jgi:hypothetical protein
VNTDIVAPPILPTSPRQVRPGRRLDRDRDFRLILGTEEARSDQSDRRQRQRADERSDGDQNHRHPVIERPRHQVLVALRLSVEPLVEALQRTRDRISSLVRFDLWIGPVGRQHRVE